MQEGCVDDLRRLSGLWGGCLKDVGRLSGGCGEAVSRMW